MKKRIDFETVFEMKKTKTFQEIAKIYEIPVSRIQELLRGSNYVRHYDRKIVSAFENASKIVHEINKYGVKYVAKKYDRHQSTLYNYLNDRGYIYGYLREEKDVLFFIDRQGDLGYLEISNSEQRPLKLIYLDAVKNKIIRALDYEEYKSLGGEYIL